MSLQRDRVAVRLARSVLRWARRAVATTRLFLAKQRSRPLRIIVGASGVSQRGWIATEADFLNLLRASDWRRHFDEGPVDAILAEHVWEHLSEEEARVAARVCFNYLKHGGYLRAAVPDGFHPDPAYIRAVEPGGSGEGALDHKVLYTHKTFRALFEGAGFDVSLLEYFDEHGDFHYSDWSTTDGHINRSSRFDKRNIERGHSYTSLILDARKR
jgi:predicted SAM-dependent methyltransferase